uniref:Uncharacterized protein n=1 Tax=Rhizophora mucronata TaxID=61149 RepID=A0A2P2NA15_RHIMU
MLLSVKRLKFGPEPRI